MATWECRDLGEAKEFLKMRITRNGQRIALDQTAYLNDVLERYGMKNAKFVNTPLPEGWRPVPNAGTSDSKFRQHYQSIIGSLLYLMLGTRPDIAFAVIKLAQFASNPSDDHMDRAHHVLRYLAHTTEYQLVYDGKSNKGLMGFSDSDWGGDLASSRSTTGFMFQLAGGVICWQSHAQKTVAHSSTEAEYMAVSDAGRQLRWIQQLLGELGIHETKTPLHMDNQGAIFNASNPTTERRTKHINIRYHYIRDLVEDGYVDLFYVEGTKNPADMFTKVLKASSFYNCRDDLGIEFKGYTPGSPIPKSQRSSR